MKNKKPVQPKAARLDFVDPPFDARA